MGSFTGYPTGVTSARTGARPRPDNAVGTERTAYVTFDRGVRSEADFCRLDRYRMVEADHGTRPRIARGGGYSYAAASFGAGSLVLDMTRFDRVLSFDPTSGLIEVEAGMTLGDLLKVTAPARLWLSVQPGYPAITIGGCIAANVHGKNPALSGTFRHSVVDITLFHPRHGTMRVDAHRDKAVFDLTCGGYGLTGVIVAATLRLQALPGTVLSMRRMPLADLAAGLARVRATPSECAFLYTWHDAAPGARPFGRGIGYAGAFVPGPPRTQDVDRRYWQLNPSGARIPFSGWNRLLAGPANRVYQMLEAMKPEVEEISLFDSLFPFARRPEIFLVFGRKGFIEYQAIVPDGTADHYIERLQELFNRGSHPSVLISMKLFRGTQRLLRYEADGICITLYLARSAGTLQLLPILDELAVETGGIPNIVKDSRLPLSIVRKLYPEYDAFRRAVRDYDPQRLFRSELSSRLDL